MNPSWLRIAFISLALILSFQLSGQSGKLEGLLYESPEQEPVIFANILVVDKGTGVTTDLEGKYSLELAPGNYTIEFSSIGYQSQTVENVKIKDGETTRLDLEMVVDVKVLSEVEVMVTPLSKKEKSPISIRTLGTQEIQYGAGSAGDISLLLQSMPGISSPPGYSNAINIRGGSSSENRFFIDDVEIPILNHFAKQGTSGGIRSILNVDFIQKVNVHTGAFPSDKGNALSGIFDFVLKDGNTEKLSSKLQIGVIDFAAVFNGPIARDLRFYISLRRSYTKLVLGVLGQPFIGTYDDWNYKIKWDFHDKHKITLLGIGANDKGEVNKNFNDTPLNRFIVDQIRPTRQWNTVNALKYTNFRKQHFTHVILSYYTLNDKTKRYLLQNDSDPNNQIEDYQSKESELRLTLKNVQRYNDLKIAFGGETGRVAYHTDATFNALVGGTIIPLKYFSDLSFNKWGAYFQVSQRLFNRFMLVTLGARVDANDYSNSMNNPLDQFSPRLSISYAILNNTTVNFNVGRYYQLPAGVTLSFRDSLGNLANQSEEVTYMSVSQLVAGLEWEKTDIHTRINIEGFYKDYDQYPFSIVDQVVLLNKDVNLFRSNNEPVISIGEGKAYGLEFQVEKNSPSRYYSRLSYTLSWSQFKDQNGVYRPSIFDTRHILTLNAGKHFGKGWHAGFKWSYQSPKPYTPNDFEKSSLMVSWMTSQALNIPDYSRLNTERMDPIMELDVRVDKKIDFDKWSLTFFIDILNVLNAQPAQAPVISVKRDAQGNPLIDPGKPDSFQTFWLANEVNTFFPSLGLIGEF